MQMRKEKILLVDDDEDILEMLRYLLEGAGYDIFTASNGLEGVKLAKKIIPDLIILDVMMPQMDGVEACIKLREDEKLNNTIITFLSARAEDYSHIAGLEAGADDYIYKPIKPRLLITRVMTLLKRKNEKASGTKSVSGIVIDKDKYVVLINNEKFHFPKKEFELLDLLVSRPEHVFTREEIMNQVWGFDAVVGDRTIDVHIRKLREKIGDSYIRTIKGVGYKLID
jgi:two-component system alkaline phosphatase synthesis response regulator PhoP